MQQLDDFRKRSSSDSGERSRPIRAAVDDEGSSASGRDLLSIPVTEVAPNTPTRLDVLIDFVSTWNVEISLKVWGFGGGLFPLLSVLHEADLIADFIPR